MSSVLVLMKNKNRNQDYTVSVILRVDTVLYTGKVKDPVKKTKVDVIVRGGTGKSQIKRTSNERGKMSCRS